MGVAAVYQDWATSWSPLPSLKEVTNRCLDVFHCRLEALNNRPQGEEFVKLGGEHFQGVDALFQGKRRAIRQLTISVVVVALLSGGVYLCAHGGIEFRDTKDSTSTPSRALQSLPPKVFPKQSIYAHPFDYIINSPICALATTLDLIASTISLWIVFLLGATNDLRLRSTLRSESSVHSDIIQGSFIDSYSNVDDDTYLNAANFFATIAPRPPDAIYGRLFEGSKPIRDPADKYHVSLEDYPASSYPNYVAGSSYVLGGHIVETLYRATGQVKPFPIEDVYITGSCAESAGIRRVGLSGFHSQRVGSPCGLKNAVTSHYTPPRKMYTLKDQLQRLEFVCYRLLFDFAYYCYCRTLLPT
ncbi:hypothetical protein HPB47_024205 [Ixodes persulcatus]|uniref:Uncharacterized protein n=1 Tax=Ixodes persulcatus TaxID=34615 RepID=A0AC60Q578_IXOPE|nr:hypothetical protein HPB47_024205 [Ixodes persulcatus]